MLPCFEGYVKKKSKTKQNTQTKTQTIRKYWEKQKIHRAFIFL